MTSYKPLARIQHQLCQGIAGAGRGHRPGVGTTGWLCNAGRIRHPSDQGGTQNALLAELGQGLSAFYSDLTAHNAADDVVVMTWSEFGRRVEENGNQGTDHGTAAPLFVLGNAVQGGRLRRVSGP